MSTPEPVCPVCNSTQVRILFRTDSLSVARHVLNADRSSDERACAEKVESLWNAPHAGYYQCADCTFEFAHPFVAGDPDFYSFVYRQANHYPVEKWEYAITEEAIRNYVHSSSIKPRLLELGAGNGSFLERVAGILIPAEDIVATEYSQGGAGSIRALGIRCFTLDVTQLTEAHLSGKVSLICLFQVLEHLSSLHAIFEKFGELSIPQSRLFISVPNFYQRKFFDQFGLHLDLPPVHVGRYSYTSLSRLAGQHGWKVLQHAIQPSTYLNKVLKFLYSAYARRQRIFDPEKYSWKPFRLLLRYSVLLFLTGRYLHILIGLRQKDLGVTQWFELERIENEQV